MGIGSRLSMFVAYGSFLFYLPLALFCPPSVAVVHLDLNYLYQFCLHTELIGKLGPLEWIFNTPSHHRVHHGRNPYAIDKNYAGFLIIWDRLFGTFEEEREDEKVVYGLVHNLKTFNMFEVQFNAWKDMCKRVRMVWRSKKFHGWTRFVNMLKAIFYGPGWFPSKAKYRLGDRNDLPKIEAKVVRHGGPLPLWLAIYSFLHFYAIQVLKKSTETCGVDTFVDLRTGGAAIVFILSIASFGFIFDNRPFNRHIEAFRCLLFALVFIPYFSEVYHFDTKFSRRFQLFYAISFLCIVMDYIYQKLKSYSNTKPTPQLDWKSIKQFLY